MRTSFPFLWLSALVLMAFSRLCAATVVISDRSGINNTSPGMAYDATTDSFFRNSFNDWQFIQLDLGSPRAITGLSRYMTVDGTNTVGVRGAQGEAAMYSVDGANWTLLTAGNTSGWMIYTNYGALKHAWHTLPYGWTAWRNFSVQFLPFAKHHTYRRASEWSPTDGQQVGL